MKTSQIHPRFAAKIFAALLLAGVCGLTGCLSKPALNKQTFAFGTPEISATNAVASGRVLGIRTLQVVAPFEGRSLVYRTGKFSYEGDPYTQFLNSPAESLMAPVRGLFHEDGNFSAVTEAGSALKPDTLVEITVSQLFGDFRNPKHPAAVLAMSFIFFDAQNGVPGKIIFQCEYSRNISLSAPTAVALMEGWNQALSEIFFAVASDFQSSQKAVPRR